MKKAGTIVLCLLILLVTVQYVEQGKVDNVESFDQIEPMITYATNGVAVLGYHHLLPDNINKKYRKKSITLSLETFEEQMQLLYENGYSSLTMEELSEYLDGNIAVPEKSVVLTFDDGYLSNYIYAYPILKKYGFRATVFVITGMVMDKTEELNSKRLNFIGWDQIHQYGDVFEHGGHTHNLHYVTGSYSHLVSSPKRKIIADLKKSQDLLQTEYFAYPYGQYNDKVIDALKETGYKMAFTTNPGRVFPGDDLYRLGRLCIDRKTTMNMFKDYVGIVE